MTIDEMRHIHQRALSDAEAKRTELRLVLASRYRELVGSSDEVLRMRERAQELHELVHALPLLTDKMVKSATSPPEETKSEGDKDDEAATLVTLRRELARLPRVIHRALDHSDVHQAAMSLIQLFGMIASHTDVYPLANALSRVKMTEKAAPLDRLLAQQMKMTYLHVETLPVKTTRLARLVLQHAAADGTDKDIIGARRTAAALSTLKLLDVKHTEEKAVELLDLYFDSKARLLQTLLTTLATTSPPGTTQTNDRDVLPLKMRKISCSRLF
jgi:flagellar hook-length control protein FliK